MVRSLYTAATGMTAQQTKLDNIAHNLANVNTAGFKKSDIVFEDLFYQELKAAGSLTATGVVHPTGIQEGLGVRVVSIFKTFSQGNPRVTENDMDVCINGEGFFAVELADGTTAYTRQGIFKRDSNGDMVTSQGYRLVPNIQIPDGMTGIDISLTGEVTVIIGNNKDEPINIGEITLSTFINPAGLHAFGENMFLPTGASGVAVTGQPGIEGRGELRQRMIEMSNVNPAEEMVEMITAQRAYEMDSKAIQTSDEMLQIINGLKR